MRVVWAKDEWEECTAIGGKGKRAEVSLGRDEDKGRVRVTHKALRRVDYLH